jgi:hypothetical protein
MRHYGRANYKGSYYVDGGFIDGAAPADFSELGLLDVGSGLIVSIDIDVGRRVVGAQVLHGLPVLVDIEIGVGTEIIVL